MAAVAAPEAAGPLHAVAVALVHVGHGMQVKGGHVRQENPAKIKEFFQK